MRRGCPRMRSTCALALRCIVWSGPVYHCGERLADCGLGGGGLMILFIGFLSVAVIVAVLSSERLRVWGIAGGRSVVSMNIVVAVNAVDNSLVRHLECLRPLH